MFLNFSKNQDNFRHVSASRRKNVYWLRRVYPSARPSVRVYQFCSLWKDFREI